VNVGPVTRLLMGKLLGKGGVGGAAVGVLVVVLWLWSVWRVAGIAGGGPAAWEVMRCRRKMGWRCRPCRCRCQGHDRVLVGVFLESGQRKGHDRMAEKGEGSR
jgi:hypothetical protein